MRMTGLDAKNDRLLEVACIITDGNLQPIDDGVSYVIKTPKPILDGMDEWCTTTHGETGLIDACLAEDAPSHAMVRTAVLAYVLDRVPDVRTACLAGSSVHADKSFLENEMPELLAHLHYRIVDVSSIKELVRRWYGAERMWQSSSTVRHRALEDIRGSMQELAFYRATVFQA
ncbi:Phosphatidylinositol 3,4,5-trisphosphate-dependent Rac exchanger 2 protein [Malassezia vespertilionis]|uniref:Phosphatidylinositol 3,4,5-trisphosphate-dependent Rac exchanger 2 protein n=1 Tax=Malassezia vespertilionis TaxID=2020962 RepID=UPI0024B1B7B9|nr:Phosphatidylinositol 3,4,5-trisphosphate-dependent Rac exchanger 2 protein [Malassezia vespertilionis]WFD04839.1 Phosphatidylinositol 3,4,5-trisphosphate-dependent Rac exchanger 2 protein [Malassezia vespertilionis]